MPQQHVRGPRHASSPGEQGRSRRPRRDGTGPAPEPRLLAALTVAAYRTVCATSAGRLLAGERAAGIVDDHRRRPTAAFDALERAFPAPTA
ncbi:hypothetical protein [Streptomyces sp. NPDC056160]|uniref:hypothetical protein n=1 Tax=Streptomyces sp. NPDC056160 TaxID=3345731 RepID=UPI0035E2D746